ncbi:predicted protein [Nematostella vectensis]|uniref:G-protein coupled receptors family 1 profile domain-containing protein n=1 Tax=Nematostella vectensis TaxID=45351 RepID=A7S1Q7_NEMVE|nr:predicted protein [Nematostella vectensis]|eukprot:XP_001634421.1 predicted protein [Nematostella vectensis]
MGYQHGVTGLSCRGTCLHLSWEQEQRQFLGNFKKLQADAPLALGKKHECSLTLYFMKSLAITDLLCSLVNAPLTCMFIYVDMLNSDWACKVYHMPLFGLPCITITNLTVIAMERYLAIFRPFWCPSQSFSKKLVIMAWVVGGSLGIILTLPIRNTHVVINSEVNTSTCLAGNEKVWEKAVFSVVMFLVYFVPNLVMLYTAVAIIINRRKRQESSQNKFQYIDTGTGMALQGFKNVYEHNLRLSYPVTRYSLYREETA